MSSLNILTGPGKWDYYMAVCDPYKHTVEFGVDQEQQPYRVMILEDGARAPDIRAFLGIAGVGVKRVWVTGLYSFSAPKGRKGGIATHGLFVHPGGPFIQKPVDLRLPGRGLLDGHDPYALVSIASGAITENPQMS
ncbi:MAG: hypothetical protein WD603_01370 [Patescibacteria group bacterium]